MRTRHCSRISCFHRSLTRVIVVITASLSALTMESILSYGQKNEDALLNECQLLCMMGNISGVQKILAEYPQIVNSKNSDGGTLLHYAVGSLSFSPNNSGLLKVLIDKGADVNVANNQGNTPLHGVVQQRSFEQARDGIRMLVSAGANVNATNKKGLTPLGVAAKNGRADIVAVLIEQGATWDIHSASELCDLEKIRSVLARNPDHVNARNSEGLCPLHTVAGKKTDTQREVASFLIQHGAQVNGKDGRGWAPIHYAVLSQSDDIVELLLDSGADVNSIYEDSETLLHLAVWNGYWQTALLLIEHGADVNAQDSFELTPIAWAQALNKPMIVAMLKDHGAQDFVFNPETTWSNYFKDPYSDKKLTAHLFTCGQNLYQSFDAWYISGVFRAKRADKNSLYIVQIYDGTLQKGFKLGGLVIFDSEGKYFRTIERERIESGLIGPDFNFETDLLAINIKVENKEIIDLPDINSDGYAEIPTAQWAMKLGQIEGNSIYLTDDDSILCAFTFENYSSNISSDGKTGEKWPLDDIPWGTIYLRFSNNKIPEIYVIVQPFKPIGPSGKTRDLSKPPRTLARYPWDSQKRTFVGPEEGPNGLWVIK